jgi:hypothetical protein
MNRYQEWALSIVCWDGALPFIVVAVSELVIWIFPNQDAVQVIFNVFIPIAAFFIRAAMADRQFKHGRQYSWQVLLFFGAIFYLVLLDALFIIFCALPKQRALRNQQVGRDDWYNLGIMYLVYLAIIAIALFPFRRGVREVQDDQTND